MEYFTCSSCGFSEPETGLTERDRFCPECGAAMVGKEIRTGETQVRDEIFLAEKEMPSPEPQYFRPEFTGSAGEYFRIWIVNTLLTILTLGIYAAWAKVRTRRYFYAHTLLSGHPFEYLADPRAILRGNLILAAGFFIYMLTNAYEPFYNGLVVILFYLIFPFLVYKSLRFYAHNSAYRNIRFRFVGTAGDSYKTYLLIPLFLIPLTLGLIIPYWAFCRKKYFFDHMAFGTAENIFSGKVKPFYKYYFVAFFGLILLAGLGIGALPPFFRDLFQTGQGNPFPTSLFVFAMAIYFLMLIIFAIAQQYLYTRVTNYCWANSRLGSVSFQSTLEAQDLLWIRLTNMVAIIFSMGLLIPWAKVRRTRYILENLTVISHAGLDDFAAGAEPETSAVGDSATDFFDIEIGL